MAASIRYGVTSLRCLLKKETPINKQQVRHRFKRIYRGKRPEEARTYAERVAELEAKEQVNIGFPLQQMRKLRKSEQTQLQNTTSALMTEGKSSEVLESFKKYWIKSNWPKDTKTICEHYGIYSDLFKEGFFYPCCRLKVTFDYDEDFVIPVGTGNVIDPSEALTKPEVTHDGDPDQLYTLVMSAPDSHLQEREKEYLHYLVGNIPGHDVDKGEQLCNYLQPFPVKGTGFHRYVFLLYQQEEKIDFSSEKRPENCTSLEDRTFSTYDFYKRLEDKMTPVSVAFFQSQWDDSTRDTFWNVLGMQEPEFEFMNPPPYHPRQEIWPHRKPFNLYLDRYRDIKDIQEEVLKEKLKNLSPFEPKPPQPKWPSLHLAEERHYPSWLKLKIRHNRRRDMHWADLD